ncbi:hypothetical protein [Streptomyces atratus]|uniref:RNA polymerase sigma-70 factor, ECF subfamily n=1 Tax=Streptomyces atratus TaxID=1893 RepID=A0A1K1XFI4_STRAR|nr:RNA polymerase sigma-70 factor, ECF subfamily [Streptomyces atratus]
MAVLDPGVVVRSDVGADGVGAPALVRGAEAVARQAMMFAPFARSSQPALVDGEPAVIATREGRRFAVMVFTVVRGKVAEMSVINDPAHLPGLDLTVLND